MDRLSREETYIRIAEIASKRSTCRRLQVGAVIVDSLHPGTIRFGYNGNYSGGPNQCDSSEAGNCGCLHAEINALIKPGYGTEMFVTVSPCMNCAKAIINSGIEKVYFREEYRDKAGIELLKSAGIKVIHKNHES